MLFFAAVSLAVGARLCLARRIVKRGGRVLACEEEKDAFIQKCTASVHEVYGSEKERCCREVIDFATTSPSTCPVVLAKSLLPFEQECYQDLQPGLWTAKIAHTKGFGNFSRANPDLRLLHHANGRYLQGSIFGASMEAAGHLGNCSKSFVKGMWDRGSQGYSALYLTDEHDLKRMQIIPTERWRKDCSASKGRALKFTIELVCEMKGERREILGFAKQKRTNGGILITSPIDNGCLKRWNAANPGQQVKKGDSIVEVNGQRGDYEKLKVALSATRRSSRLRLVIAAGEKDRWIEANRDSDFAVTVFVGHTLGKTRPAKDSILFQSELPRVIQGFLVRTHAMLDKRVTTDLPQLLQGIKQKGSGNDIRRGIAFLNFSPLSCRELYDVEVNSDGNNTVHDSAIEKGDPQSLMMQLDPGEWERLAKPQPLREMLVKPFQDVETFDDILKKLLEVMLTQEVTTPNGAYLYAMPRWKDFCLECSVANPEDGPTRDEIEKCLAEAKKTKAQYFSERQAEHHDAIAWAKGFRLAMKKGLMGAGEIARLLMTPPGFIQAHAPDLLQKLSALR